MKGTFPFDFSWAKTVDQVLPYPLVRFIICRVPQPFKSILKNEELTILPKDNMKYKVMT